jgi:hypothetical protein
LVFVLPMLTIRSNVYKVFLHRNNHNIISFAIFRNNTWEGWGKFADASPQYIDHREPKWRNIFLSRFSLLILILFDPTQSDRLNGRIIQR